MVPTVLIVDDEPHICRLIQVNLEREGYAALVAHDGHEAMRLLEREHVDFMILDMIMPHMNGLEVLRNVRSNPALRHLRVILLTAKARDADIISRVWKAVPDACLTKPFQMEELLSLLKRLEDDEGLGCGVRVR